VPHPSFLRVRLLMRPPGRFYRCGFRPFVAQGGRVNRGPRRTPLLRVLG
jgi:hypothetical protein